MNISIPAGKFAIIPVSALETAKRYSECLRDFACEITGKDAAACVTTCCHYGHEIEKITDTCFRIHKETEHLTRHIVHVVNAWQAADSSRQVSAHPICLEHDTQKAIDSSNKHIEGQDGKNAGFFKGGYTFTSGGIAATLTFDDEGNCTGIVGKAPDNTDEKQQIEELKHIVGDLSAKLIEAQSKAAESKTEENKTTLKVEPTKKTRRAKGSTSKTKS